MQFKSRRPEDTTQIQPFRTCNTSFLQKQSDPEAGFNLETLVFASMDLFEAGTETLTTTLRWGLLFLLKYPDVQSEYPEPKEMFII